MQSRSTHNQLRARMLCALLVAVVAVPSSSNAAPGSSHDSGLVAQARQQIRIAASVRPAMTVRRQKSTDAHQGELCIWSNMATRQFDIRAELQRPGSGPVQLGLNDKTVGATTGYQPSWIRDQAAAGRSDCAVSKKLLAAMTSGHEVPSGVLTLLITPQ